MIANVIDDVADHPFARQREAGVLVTVNSDDPGMMGTTICDDYEAVTDRFGYDADTIEGIALDAIGAELGTRRRAGRPAGALRDRDGRPPRAARAGAAVHLTARMPP